MPGSRGPLRLPKGLRVLDGDGDAGDLDEVDSVQDLTAPARPDRPVGWSDGDAASPTLDALWDSLSEQLDRAGLLAACDGPVLELGLRHFLAARAAADELAERGPVVPAGDGSLKKNPAGAEFRAQSQLFIEYSKLLGMSFGARARIPAKDDGGGEANPFASTGS